MRRLTILLAAAAMVAAPALAQEEPAEPSAGVAISYAIDGGFLTDSEGRTLYLFLNDSDGVSTCMGDCLVRWPAFLAADDLDLAEGLDAALFGTTERDDGAIQVTYGGWPLYYFAGDKDTGEVNGQAVGELWYLVAVDGSPLTDAVPAATGDGSEASGD